jgi:hypothetical protein
MLKPAHKHTGPLDFTFQSGSPIEEEEAEGEEDSIVNAKPCHNIAISLEHGNRGHFGCFAILLIRHSKVRRH